MNFLTVLVVLLQTFGPVQCFNSKSSTIGKDFYFGIFPYFHGYIKDQSNIITIDVTNVSPQDVQIRLQIPYLHNDSYYYIPTGQSKTFYIPPEFQIYGTLKDSRGIRITSDGDASVIVSNRYKHWNGAMDVYNVLPTTSIGKRYMIASYRGFTDDVGSRFLATGVSNNTNLTVYVNGASHSVLLNALDVYQYLCQFGGGGKLCDLSGALLVSDKNIAVIAGSSWSDSSIKSSDGDILASEMFPTSTWTTSYIIPPLYPQPRFSFRVMSENDALITFSNTTRSFSSKADLREMCFETLPVLVFANKPFSVSQYGITNPFLGDIFLAAVPGIDQYINNYVFTVPLAFSGNTTSHIALIVPLKMKDTLMLDGQSVKARSTSVGDITQLSVPPPFDNYTVLTFQTTEGIHHFWHPQSDVTFGVFVYGLGNRLGYGFYAGYNLPGKEGKEESFTTVQKATTTATTTRTVNMGKEGKEETIVQKATTKATTTTANMGRMCYNCNDLSHPDLCDTVEKCANNEVCFVKTFTESGRRKFRSGCLRNDVCQTNMNNSRLTNEHCFECCNIDYCNNKGCGEAGIPDRNSRGPICYDCQHVYNPEECHKITPCEQHLVCRIEGTTWFSRSHFKMGCGDGLCDPVSTSLKRSTPICLACCSDDYCNKNCTKPSNP